MKLIYHLKNQFTIIWIGTNLKQFTISLPIYPLWNRQSDAKMFWNFSRIRRHKVYNISGLPISILVSGGGGRLPSPLGGVPGVGDGEPVTSGGAVYISLCQPTGIYNSLAHSCAPISHLYWREGDTQSFPYMSS